MSVPVMSEAQMREWELASWAAGCSEADVIRRVGEAVVRRAQALTRNGDLILLLAGKGHNGDDARAAQNHFTDRRVELLNVNDPQGDLHRLKELLAQRPALIVDGLLGIGLNRPLDAEWIKLVNEVNEARRPVLAVDIPSGLNADTGEVEEAAIRATVTLTVGAPKLGLLETSAAPFVGRLEVADAVGLVDCPIKRELQWISPDDFAGFPPPREASAHKGDFGHLAIVAGSLGYHGAAVLAARGAQRAQPGRVTLFTPPDVYHGVAAQLQAVMVSPWQPEIKFPGNFSAVLIGPGLAAPNLTEEWKLCLRRLWLESPVPVVVDASALDWLPMYPLPQTAIRVITPHPGEAARLWKNPVKAVQADRSLALREISRRYGNCWVVLKGNQTLIGRGTGDVFVNSSGNPHLAQGGSGDLLAGYLAGLLAQPALQADPVKTICHAVWQHGAAADKLACERKNWVVEDLADAIGGI